MSDVNPMLAPSDLRSDREKVTALFGQVSEVVLKAVGEFLEKNPGALDHHNLRLIASAAPHIDDPKLVAELIDRLPITKMHIGLRPIDIDAARADLQRVLPHYSPRTRVNLVSDLVHKTAVDVLMFSPPERLTREARQFVASHLMNLANREEVAQAWAIASEHTNEEVIDTVLDNVERRIARSERGTTVRPPSRLPLRIVSAPLREALRPKASKVTVAQLERAWSLIRRCEPDSQSMLSLIADISGNPELSAPIAHSVLDAIEEFGQLPDADPLLKEFFGPWMRGVMISVPEIPESVARRAVAEGVREPPNPYGESGSIIDQRFYLYRSHNYDTRRQGGSVSASTSARWQSHAAPGHNFEDGPSEQLSSVEVDHWLAACPADVLTPEVVETMTDRDALWKLSTRYDVGKRLLPTMSVNPNTPRTVFVRHLEDWNNELRQVSASQHHDYRIPQMGLHPA